MAKSIWNHSLDKIGEVQHDDIVQEVLRITGHDEEPEADDEDELEELSAVMVGMGFLTSNSRHLRQNSQCAILSLSAPTNKAV